MKMVQSDETFYFTTISKRCNLIQRYNIWYNNHSISLLFYALFYSRNICNIFINNVFNANENIQFNNFNNKVLPKAD